MLWRCQVWPRGWKTSSQHLTEGATPFLPSPTHQWFCFGLQYNFFPFLPFSRKSHVELNCSRCRPLHPPKKLNYLSCCVITPSDLVRGRKSLSQYCSSSLPRTFPSTLSMNLSTHLPLFFSTFPPLYFNNFFRKDSFLNPSHSDTSSTIIRSMPIFYGR